MTVQITSKTSCPQCNATDRGVKKNKINTYAGYEKNMLEDKTEAEQEAFRTWAKAEGHSSFPIVITDTPIGSWAGYNPDKLKALGAYLKEQAEAGAIEIVEPAAAAPAAPALSVPGNLNASAQKLAGSMVV